jgi:hypothetical protein
MLSMSPEVNVLDQLQGGDMPVLEVKAIGYLGAHVLPPGVSVLTSRGIPHALRPRVRN